MMSGNNSDFHVRVCITQYTSHFIPLISKRVEVSASRMIGRNGDDNNHTVSIVTSISLRAEKNPQQFANIIHLCTFICALFI